jgi:hypothetical protein
MDDRPVMALRAAGGHSLIVFVGEGVRLAVPDGQPPPESATPEMLAAARPLTSTERIYSGPDCAWLVQASGPAWSDDAAADACGLVFTSLDGTMTRASLTGRPPGPLPPDAELDALLERALDASGVGSRNDG